MRVVRMIALLASTLLLQACCGEVGSQAWCQKLEQKDKSNWSEAEAGDYAKHCIFGELNNN